MYESSSFRFMGDRRLSRRRLRPFRPPSFPETPIGASLRRGAMVTVVDDSQSQGSLAEGPNPVDLPTGQATQDPEIPLAQASPPQ